MTPQPPVAQCIRKNMEKIHNIQLRVKCCIAHIEQAQLRIEHVEHVEHIDKKNPKNANKYRCSQSYLYSWVSNGALNTLNKLHIEHTLIT